MPLGGKLRGRLREPKELRVQMSFFRNLRGCAGPEGRDMFTTSLFLFWERGWN